MCFLVFLTLADFSSSETILTQLVLDPSSMHLATRVQLMDPILPKWFSLARDLFYLFVYLIVYLFSTWLLVYSLARLLINSVPESGANHPVLRSAFV